MMFVFKHLHFVTSNCWIIISVWKFKWHMWDHCNIEKWAFYIKLCNCNYAYIITADRCWLQPFIYVPSLDVLLRTKCPVVFRRENGRPEVVGCLLLYFLLRHSSMISVINIKASCNAMNIRDARCGWKQAVDTIKEDNRRIRLQKWPTMHEQRLPTSCSDKTMEEKFGGVCKSLLERVKDATQWWLLILMLSLTEWTYYK